MTKNEAHRQIEAILVADYPAEADRLRADVERETCHEKCSPIWLHDMAAADSSISDEAMEKIRDVCDEYYYR